MNIKGMSAREIKDYLREDRGQFAIYWCIEDVITNAEDNGIDPLPNDQQAAEILNTCLSAHDCDCGITWGMIVDVTEECVKSR